jgi:hypothetical protein
MGTEHASVPQAEATLWYHVRRSLVNQYWPFSFVPPASLTMGMAIATAATDATWNWRLWGLGVLFLVVTDQGMKSIDLAAPDINVDVDSNVQFRVGVLMVVVGVGLGVLLARMTSWWFLVILATGVAFGVIYNLSPGPQGESPRGLDWFDGWFDGLFHDKRYLLGRGNLGFCVGFLPTLVGYFLLTHTVSPGAVLVGAGPGLHMAAMIWVIEDYKDTLYPALGISYERPVGNDVERLKVRSVKSQLYRLVAFVLTAIGLYVELVLGPWV